MGAMAVGEVFSEFVGADAVVDGDGGGKESESCEGGASEDAGVGEVAGGVGGEPEDGNANQAEKTCRGNPKVERQPHDVSSNYSIARGNRCWLGR